MENMWPGLPIEGWNYSDAGLEDNCVASSDALLLLDEMPKARDRAVIDSVYFIMNGRPRSVRSVINKTSNATREIEWSMAVFSASEDPFEEIVKRAPGTSDGALVRMIDIKPASIWQDLHSHTSQYDLIKQITSSLPKTSGIAGPVFVNMLVKQYQKIVSTAPSILDATLRELERTLAIQRAQATGMEMRILEAFALVATAGQLAGKMGVLPQSPTGCATKSSRLPGTCATQHLPCQIRMVNIRTQLKDFAAGWRKTPVRNWSPLMRAALPQSATALQRAGEQKRCISC